MYISQDLNTILLILSIWTIPWKIYAVWLAARNNSKKWFVLLLVLNTASILEIFYIFKIAHKNWKQVKEDFKKALSSFK